MFSSTHVGGDATFQMTFAHRVNVLSVIGRGMCKSAPLIEFKKAQNTSLQMIRVQTPHTGVLRLVLAACGRAAHPTSASASGSVRGHQSCRTKPSSGFWCSSSPVSELLTNHIVVIPNWRVYPGELNPDLDSTHQNISATYFWRALIARSLICSAGRLLFVAERLCPCWSSPKCSGWSSFEPTCLADLHPLDVFGTLPLAMSATRTHTLTFNGDRTEQSQRAHFQRRPH